MAEYLKSQLRWKMWRRAHFSLNYQYIPPRLELTQVHLWVRMFWAAQLIGLHTGGLCKYLLYEGRHGERGFENHEAVISVRYHVFFFFFFVTGAKKSFIFNLVFILNCKVQQKSDPSYPLLSVQFANVKYIHVKTDTLYS